MGTWNVLLRAKQKMLLGTLTFSGELFRMGLWRAGANLSNVLDVSTVASITSQLASARGYGTTGKQISNTAVTVSGTTAWGFTGDGTCWSANGGVLGSGGASIQYAVIWRSGGAKTGMPVCYATLSTAFFTVAAGSALKINGGTASGARIFTLT